ncbi:nucleoside monophosphate kinase, partial [Candidatus Saccharibacteria bacterium]|nr:nucleoside monophosphate kinase [Candidatus Saccharibacteria bacterium]
MILILGNPGAGKTTQTHLLGEYLKCPWFSMGELIRDNVTGDDRKAMLAGKIIDDDVTLNIVDKALDGLDLVNKECVFEGNPRSIKQAEWWLGQQAAGRLKITGLIHMVADPKVAEDRMIKRGRLDDHDDNVIETRFNEYQRSVQPTLDFLIKNGVKVHTIS